MQRIAIIGPSGAGKSTLARRLQVRLDLPLVHLDLEYDDLVGQGHQDHEWEARLAGLVAGERWIIDGNYGSSMQFRLEAADTIVFLDVNTRTSLYRVLKRWVTCRLASNGQRAIEDGGPDRLDLALLRWVVWTYPRKRRAGITARVRGQVGKKRVYILRTRSGFRRFLDSLPHPDEDRR